MSEYSINLFKFSIICSNKIFHLSLQEKDENYFYLPSKAFPKEVNDFSEMSTSSGIWCTDKSIKSDYETTIDLDNDHNKSFAKKYINHIIFMHFSEKSNILVNKNFINDTSLYVEDKSCQIEDDYLRYDSFSLRVDINKYSKGIGLLLSYNGSCDIHNKSLFDLKIPNDILGKVKYKNKIISFKKLSNDEKKDIRNIFPFLNHDIRRYLHIKFDRNYTENKYRKNYFKIDKFFENNLKGEKIDNAIEFFNTGMQKLEQSKIYQTSKDSNLLLFGNKNNHYVPYTGIKQYGPILPYTAKPIRMLFIFHQDDKDYANRLYAYFKKGFKNFPGLESFINLEFEIDTDRSIKFTSKNPINEISQKFEEINQSIGFSEDYTYIAIYISRIDKNSDDEELDEVYYKLKELLLTQKIVSQVIIKDNITNDSFNYFLPNIAIALLAKIGGIPWRLFRPIKKDLVIGVGADRTKNVSQPYIGSAFCFENDGNFLGFNVFEEGEVSLLAESIKKAIISFVEENKEIKRLVIHYYKTMSYREEQPIQEILKKLSLSIPYVIVTINETLSSDYVFFDDSYDGKMPMSGKFISIRHNEFLLCNNTRYGVQTASKIDGYPLPVKIKIRSNDRSYIDNFDVVRELIDQVYQFSRMYWKSVKQRNLPVTIEYSKLIAKMVTHFGVPELNDFGRSTLWFL